MIANQISQQDLRDRVWPMGVYIRTPEGWFASPQDLRDGSSVDRIILFGDRGRERERRTPAEAQEVLSLSTQGQYRGYWLGMGSITDSNGVTIHAPAPRGAMDRHAHLFYGGTADAEHISQLPGATALRPFDHLEGAFRLRLLITESDGLMRTKTEAEQAALRFLSTSAADDGVERVIPREPVEAGADWVFSYQGHGYVQRGDLDEMLIGNMPIVVPKRDQLPYALNALDDVDD